jgi:hypothetical protein
MKALNQECVSPKTPLLDVMLSKAKHLASSGEMLILFRMLAIIETETHAVK